jgi:hypothetical protein
MCVYILHSAPWLGSDAHPNLEVNQALLAKYVLFIAANCQKIGFDYQINVFMEQAALAW